MAVPLPLTLVLVTCVRGALTKTVPTTLPTTTFVTTPTTTTPTTTTPDSSSCALPDGTVIQATFDNPHVIIDDGEDYYSCMQCFCSGSDYYYYDDDYGGDGGDALCIFADCATPRCVDPKRTAADQCCPECPNGENCYKPDTEKTKKKKNKKKKKKNKDKKKDEKSDKKTEKKDKESNQKTEKKDKESNQKTEKKDKESNQKTEKTDKESNQKTEKKDKESNKNKEKKKKNCPRETMPAGENIVIGDQVCRCDDTELDLFEPYNTEALCEPV